MSIASSKALLNPP